MHRHLDKWSKPSSACAAFFPILACCAALPLTLPLTLAARARQGAALRRRGARAAALPAGLRGSAAGALSTRLSALEASHAALGGAVADVARDVARTRAKLRLARHDDGAQRRGADAALARHEAALAALQGAWRVHNTRACPLPLFFRVFALNKSHAPPPLPRPAPPVCAGEHEGLAAAVDALSGVVRKQFRVLAAGASRACVVACCCQRTAAAAAAAACTHRRVALTRASVSPAAAAAGLKRVGGAASAADGGGNGPLAPPRGEGADARPRVAQPAGGGGGDPWGNA
jgi:hypothetical protein